MNDRKDSMNVNGAEFSVLRLLGKGKGGYSYLVTSNFVPHGGTLYYIDYACNAYMEAWDFAHWGLRYWTAKKAGGEMQPAPQAGPDGLSFRFEKNAGIF